jgi:hypothetical protein
MMNVIMKTTGITPNVLILMNIARSLFKVIRNMSARLYMMLRIVNMWIHYETCVGIRKLAEVERCVYSS